MKPISQQKSVIWITFGDSLNVAGITLESLTNFLLAMSNKVKMDESEIEAILVEVLN